MNRILGRTFGMSLFLVVLCCALSACNSGNPVNSGDANKTATSKDAPADVKSAVKPAADTEVAVFETADYGSFAIELYPNVAPKMVERFKKLISEHAYDNTAIHRVDAKLGIIQGGDPLTKGGNVEMYGTGSSPYPNVPAEFSDIPYDRGTVGAARTADINGANCQFFVTLKRQPAFDKKYTVFGRVIDGIKTAEVIMGAPTAEGTSRPADKVVIKSVTLKPRASFPQ